MRPPRPLKLLFMILGGAMVAVVACCGWLLGTETGRLWAVAQAQKAAANLGVSISIENLASPSLAHWQAQSILVTGQEGPLVEAHNLELRWRPGALFRKHVEVNLLTASRLEYFHPHRNRTSDNSGATPQFPLRFTLDQLTIESLGVHQVPTVRDRQLPNYRVQTAAELFGPDYPLQLQLELHSLDSEQTHVSVKTEAAATGEVKITGWVQEEPGGLLGTLARWPAGDPLHAQFRIHLVQADRVLHLVVEDLSGKLQGHALKAAGTLDYRRDDQSLRLPELELLVDGKRQRLRGSYSPADLWIEANLTEIPLDLVTPWYAPITSGAVSGRFDLTWVHRERGRWPQVNADLEGEVDYAQQHLILDIEGALDNQLLHLKPSRLRYGAAELTAQGILDFAGAASDLTGRITQFHTDLLNPWGVPIPKELKAATEETQFHLRGALREPEVALTSPRIHGVYKGQAFELAVDGEANRHSARLRSFQLAADKSELKAQGLVDWSGGANDLQVSFKDLREELLSLAPPDVADRLPEGLSLTANGDATVSGRMGALIIQSHSRVSGSYSLKGETLGYRIDLDGNLTTGSTDKMNLSAHKVELFLEDRLTLSLSGTYNAKAMDLRLQLNELPTRVLEALGWRNIEGVATADLHLTGNISQPELAGHADYSDKIPGEKGGLPLKLHMDVSTEQGRLLLATHLRSPRATMGQMLISLPANLYLQPHTGPLPLNLDAKGDWELGALRLLSDMGIHSLEGRSQIDLQLRGTVAQPLVQGKVQLEKGTYQNRATGTLLENIKLTLVGDQERILIEEARARSGDGELQLKGVVNWQQALRQSQDAVDLSLDIKRANLLQRNDLQGEVAGNIQVTGSFAELWVKGVLDVSPLNANVDSAVRTRIPQIQVTEIEAPLEPNDAGPNMPVVHLDLQLRADQQAYLRGRGLDTELAGNIAVTGTVDKPQYRGLFTTRRGRLELFGKRFMLEKGEVRFNNSGVILRIPAVHKTQEIEIRAELHGTTAEPKLKLSSVPVLPEDEILARLIFGKSVQEISAFEAIRLAAAVRSLTSGGGLDPVDSARSLLGVDSLTIDSETTDSGDSNYTLGVGKYLNERVYVEIGRSSNPAQPWSGAIEVELTPNVILESRTNQTGGTGAVLMWKRDY